MTDEAPTPATSASTPSFTQASKLAPIVIETDGQELVLRDHRLSVTAEGRTVLDLSIADVRRVQFDIERARPATLVVVPDRAREEPRIIVVPVEQFSRVGDLLAAIGRRLDETSDR